jgi:steroid delta-isomerase-like uncharacterized protein
MSPDAVVERYFAELLNAGDFSRAAELLTPDFAFHGPSSPGGLDAAGFEAFVHDLRRAFPDKRFAEIERVAEGDRIASRFRMTGTHQQSYLGLPPTRRRIDIEGCDLLYLQDGRLREVRSYFDTTTMLRQLGFAR